MGKFFTKMLDDMMAFGTSWKLSLVAAIVLSLALKSWIPVIVIAAITAVITVINIVAAIMFVYMIAKAIIWVVERLIP